MASDSDSPHGPAPAGSETSPSPGAESGDTGDRSRGEKIPGSPSESAAEVSQLTPDVYALMATIDSQEQELALKEQQFAERDQEILRLRWIEKGLRNELLRLEHHASIIEQSRSFKVTAPLRRVVALRSALSDRWTAAGQRVRHRGQLLRYRSRGAAHASAPPAVTALLPVAVDVADQDPAAATSPGRPVTIAGEERTALLAHPPCRLSYRITVPARASCRAHVALLPEVWERCIDGVEFRLTAALVDGGEVSTSRFISSPGRLPHHRRWTELRLSLAQFAGREVALTLSTSVPDDGLAHFAWALWGDPEILCGERHLHQLSWAGSSGSREFDPSSGSEARVSPGQDVPRSSFGAATDYESWIAVNEPDDAEMRTMAARQLTWTARPKLSVLMPVFDPRPEHLAEAIKSVCDQLYDNWELCIADGGSTDPHVRRVLEAAEAESPKIKVAYLGQNRNIAGNSNAALELATGEFVALLDHDDTLTRFALYEVVRAILERPQLDVVYSDEDKIDAASESARHAPHFKPAWSPDTFLSHNYVNHFSVIRRTLVNDVGGFRDGFEGSQDYDLYLRVFARTEEIAHIPKVLYHWRAVPGSAAADRLAKPHAFGAAKRAIREHLDTRGVEVEVIDGKFAGSYRVRYSVPESASVDIVIPTRDRLDLLRPCIESILGRTSHRTYTIHIVDHLSRNRETHDYLREIAEHEHVQVHECGDQDFNFARMNNAAVALGDADYVAFLNNDTQVVEGEWLTAMLEFAQREDVGAVGAKLLYADRRVQHAGVIVGLGGVAGHAHLGISEGDPGYFGRADIVQNVSAVTAACMVMRRAVFEELGGFDEQLGVAFNDTDLCLRLREAGYLIVYTPYAVLLHHESRSRGSDLVPDKVSRFDAETALITERWAGVIAAGDPYYSPHLTDEAVRSFELRTESSITDSNRASRKAPSWRLATPPTRPAAEAETPRSL